ncbi:MAG: efflux RND transporter periplasmic adaptor subunit [Caldilineaceae bacterium]|nr:efflux RND transporter periplasmic adaptor subunit [Caldilineaceae bacterium]
MKRFVNRLTGMALVAVTAMAAVGLPFTPQVMAQSTDTPRLQRPLTAVGMVEVVDQYQVVLETGGRVREIGVQVGDTVQEGNLLVALETAQLEDAVERAELALESARIDLNALTKKADASDIAVAEANLLQAQENLALVAAGPTNEELQAAENTMKAAWANYEELRTGPTAAQITLAKANLAQAEINLQQAQREYDKIAWLPEAAATDTADNLQRATITYEGAKAAFDEASKPTTTAQLLNALSAAQSSENSYNRLEEKPTPAELAAAEAAVAAAENALDKLTKGPEDADVQRAELRVRQALLDLDQAGRDLANAQVRAPIAGTVLALNVEMGQQGSAGSHIVTLADTSQLKLMVNVEQTDIIQIENGQPVDIVLYALPERVYSGVVQRIAPAGSTETGTVTFPVTIHLADDDLSAVRPGMTASATFVAGEQAD